MIAAAIKTQRGQRLAPHARRYFVFCLAAAAVLSLSTAKISFAENPWASSKNVWGASHNAWGNSQNPWTNSRNSWGRAASPKAGTGKPSNYGGYVAVPSDVVVTIPSMVPRCGQYTDKGAIPDGLKAPHRLPKRHHAHWSKRVSEANETGCRYRRGGADNRQ